MGLFVSVTVKQEKCPSGCRICVDACPVNIFAVGSAGAVSSVVANDDECTFCDLCLARCPADAVAIEKHY